MRAVASIVSSICFLFCSVLFVALVVVARYTYFRTSSYSGIVVVFFVVVLFRFVFLFFTKLEWSLWINGAVGCRAGVYDSVVGSSPRRLGSRGRR